VNSLIEKTPNSSKVKKGIPVSAGMALALAKHQRYVFRADEYQVYYLDGENYQLFVNGEAIIETRQNAHKIMDAISNRWTYTTERPTVTPWDVNEKGQKGLYEDFANGMIKLARTAGATKLAEKAEAQLYREIDTAFQPSLGEDTNKKDYVQIIADHSDTLYNIIEDRKAAEMLTLFSP
jgi:hypothetical protein